MFNFSDIPVVTLRLYPSDFLFFKSKKTKKTKGDKFTVLPFRRSESRGRIFSQSHQPQKDLFSRQDLAWKGLESPRMCWSGALLSALPLRASAFFWTSDALLQWDGYGVLPLETPVVWHHGNLPGRLCEGSSVLLLAVSFVVVYIVSKYVIPLRLSYIIYVSPVFREETGANPLPDSSPAEWGYQ